MSIVRFMLEKDMRPKRAVGWVILGIGIAVCIGWPIVALGNWNDIIASHTRVGYLVGDLWLLAPGCVLCGAWLVRGHPYGTLVLLITIGVATFDLTHTFIYTWQIGYPKIDGKALPAIAYVGVILLTWAILNVWAWREMRIEAARASNQSS